MISESFCKDFFWLNTITYTRTLPFCRSITTALAFVSKHRIPGHSTETFPAQLNFLRCPALHSCVSRGRRGNVYTLNSTLNNLHFTLHTLHFTLHILYTLHSTIYTLPSTIYTLHPTYSTLYTPHFTLYTPHTLHSTLHNLHFTLDTLHSTYSTLSTPE